MKFLSSRPSTAVAAFLLSAAAVTGQPVLGHGALGAADLARRQDTTVPLRIMPLGASITWGTESEDGNGYRKVLRDDLVTAGFSVDMVGSQKSGDMEDNDNEGHPGWRIAEVSSAADATIPEQPNVVLINAGTNDCIQNYNVSTAHERMRSLVEKLFAEIPGTTVVLSTLLPNAVDSVDERVDSVNEKFRELVATLSSSGSTAEGAEGQRIVLAEMNNGYITRDELVEDGIHPNKEGYNKMAARWYEVIIAASKDGLIQVPNEV